MTKFSKFNDIDAVMTKANRMLFDIEQGYSKCLQEEKIPESLLVDIKDYLANLRSSLDYLWCKISNASNGYFPIANSEKEFNNKTVNVDKKYVDILKRWQSYDKNSWIRCFNLFRNKNVHFTLIPQTKEELREFSIKEVGSKEKMVTFSGCTFSGTGNHISVDDVPVPIDLKTQFPENVEGLDIERKIWVNFLFDGSSISSDFPTGVSVLPFLKESFKNVSQIVTELEEVFCIGKFKKTDIGYIPEDWDVFLLNDLADIIGGGTPRTNEPTYWNGNIPWLSVVDFNNDFKKVYITEKTITELGLKNSSTKLLKSGSLVISARGTVGALAQLGIDMVFNQSCYGLVSKYVSNDLLYYLVKNAITDIKNRTHGSVFDTITKETLNTIKLGVPRNINEQEKIAETLSSLDDKIEFNQKINNNLEKLASLLFKQWFVDFEFPNENGKPFKSSGGKMIDSELGEIPKGWSIGFLGDNKLTQLVKPGIDEFKGEKIYLPTANVNESSIVDLNYKITYYNRPSRANMQPFPNSIWFAKMKNSKKVQLFLEREKWKLKNVILSTGFTGIRPLSNSTFYIWTIINSDFFEREKSNLAIGTTMQAINNENIRRIRYIIPQKNILDCFEKKVCMLYEAISINKEQIKSFSKIRDSLLPRLMSGKIKVG